MMTHLSRHCPSTRTNGTIALCYVLAFAFDPTGDLGSGLPVGSHAMPEGGERTRVRSRRVLVLRFRVDVTVWGRAGGSREAFFRGRQQFQKPRRRQTELMTPPANDRERTSETMGRVLT